MKDNELIAAFMGMYPGRFGGWLAEDGKMVGGFECTLDKSGNLLSTTGLPNYEENRNAQFEVIDKIYSMRHTEFPGEVKTRFAELLALGVATPTRRIFSKLATAIKAYNN